MMLHVLIAMVAGWLQRHQQQAITYLLAENRALITASATLDPFDPSPLHVAAD